MIDLVYGIPRTDCAPENMPAIVTSHAHKEEVAKLAKMILEKDPGSSFLHL